MNCLNPRPVDVITGFIMQNIKGDGIKKKLAAQRLNNINACISSYACVLNSELRMKQGRKANKVAMMVTDIQRDKDDKKKWRAAQNKQEDKEKARKKVLDAEVAVEKREKSMKGCMQLSSEIIKKGIGCINKFNMDQLKLLLCYYYDDDIYKKKGTKK
eukprot:4270263-Ditylum_brightwellii.AAC.1